MISRLVLPLKPVDSTSTALFLGNDVTSGNGLEVCSEQHWTGDIGVQMRDHEII
jgi:hypothetical protein